MNDFQRLKQLFDEIVELSAEQRDKRLAKGDIDEPTCQRLRTLLDADLSLDGATARRAIRSLSGDCTTWVGRRVGAFVIDLELGRGGMGNVFLAHRADGGAEQKVAIKLVRPEHLDEHTMLRFRLERQVLALLKHPNIAILLDLGDLADGTPYVVMEYIEGQPILDHVREHSLTLRQRLLLFLEVCDAVAYAHRSMVVHRDLKSSNILVTSEGRPKLLDFGIAKPLLGRFGSEEIFETSDAQRFLSPLNAAPEQLRGDPITVACDVYGLGILLYALLTGCMPFDFGGMTALELQRQILEVEPINPSARVANLMALELRGDLDAITLQALRKSPLERYTSVEQFAVDIKNYLDSRPVAASRGHKWYRLRKFASRHRIGLGVVGAFVGVLATTGVMLGMQAAEVVRQRDRAVYATNFLVETFRAADPEKALGEKLTAKQILDQAERSLTTGTVGIPALRAELMAKIAEVKLHLGVRKEILPLVAQALEILKTETHPDPEVLAKLLDIEARAATALGQYDLARSALQDAEKLALDTRMRAILENDTIDLLYVQGATDALQPHLNTALHELAPQLALDEPVRWALLVKVAEVQEVVAGVETSIRILEELLQGNTQAMGAVNVLKAKVALAGMYDDAARYKEAQALMESVRQPLADVYGDDSLTLASWANEMANILQKQGQSQRAISLYDTAFATYNAQLGPKSPHAPNIKFNMAGAAESAERWDEAERNYVESIRLAGEILPETNENIEMFRTAYALLLNKRHRFAAAEGVFNTVVARTGRDPKFVDDDVYKAAVLGRVIARYANSRTESNRIEFERAFTIPSDASGDLKQIAAEQRAVAQSAGLSLPQ